ncbi:Iron(III) dicitrate transport ATP-binding protein FecE (TC 3.A.1.14.1) [hydrothermal vent metagenome]|uniref:Iron(III) dicitrate transport ATP-binding protein FecE (TC 3.A.1.14.1) n=1 Tax=hydrothermal vent metagenome TaxID=652676 RepID=A0A3B0YZK7_9ZZZZ
MTTLLEARGLSVTMGEIQCLNQIDLSLKRGELIGLIGPNGAGKSSLLKAMAGLQEMTHGTVLLGGADIAGSDSRERGRVLGYLAQSGEIHWPIQVKRLVELGRVPHLSAWASLGAQDQQQVEAALKQTGTWHLKERTATTLSGGEKCRVLLARVLAGEPKIMLADEPIAALDPAHQLMVMNSFRQFVDAGGGAILALHDLTIAARYCDQLVLLDAGKRVIRGTPDEVLTEARLASVYGIKATLGRDANGRLTVAPYALST